MPAMQFDRLLDTASAVVSDVRCPGGCRHDGETECARSTQIVFPYQGVFVRRVGSAQAVADANQVLFFNEGQEYTVSHPQEGADACLSLSLDPAMLREVTAPALLARGSGIQFLRQHARIDAHAQKLLAQLRRALRGGAQALACETLLVDLLRRALGTGGAGEGGATAARRKLVERAKLVMASDPARRWTLAGIARETGGSPVYLTQLFQQVEGMPLYRYQLQLRLARALTLIDQYDDLAAMSFDLGFSSHSHFSNSFRQAYGQSPSSFRGSRA